MNKIFLTGHLGSDPVLREAATQKKYCHLSLATDEVWRDKDGQRHKRTEWHSVFFWGPAAEILVKYLHKGSKVLVEGRLESREEAEANGASAKPPVRIWSIRGLRYEFLDRKPEDSPTPSSNTDVHDDDPQEDDLPL